MQVQVTNFVLCRCTLLVYVGNLPHARAHAPCSRGIIHARCSKARAYCCTTADTTRALRHWAPTFDRLEQLPIVYTFEFSISSVRASSFTSRRLGPSKAKLLCPACFTSCTSPVRNHFFYNCSVAAQHRHTSRSIEAHEAARALQKEKLSLLVVVIILAGGQRDVVCTRLVVGVLTIPATGLCQRRHWPDPTFEPSHSRRGWACTVRVNNREYTSDSGYESEALAREAAATRAYAICRDFSLNDGMFPGQRQGQPGVVQGLPVAIGTGRRSRKSTSAHQYSSALSQGYQDAAALYEDTASRGSSPRSSDSGIDFSSRRSSKSSSSSYLCGCGRAAVRSAYERCGYCVQDASRWY